MARLDVSRLSDGGGIYTPPAVEDPGIAADRKIAADIAAATGQKVDPRTGQIIIDETELYHIGASLKDVGKKWFAFSKMDSESLKILSKLP